MATDKISVDLLLNTRKAERELAKLNKEFAKLGKTMGGAFGGPGKGGDKVRALGTGLSKATVKADEFTKSLEASNARVVAFGASAGIIMQIDRAFKGLVTSTMKVEKALLDVNVVLNASTKQLKVFGAEMFKIARGTAQSFEVVAEATTELARQGLGTEKTLKRTNDALILTRLTGMGAADSVKSLTAAVNSFNKEGVTSAQVINRMAKVDAAFAVSSDDLAKAISRVGASAVSAGVTMNELMAITTAVQQKTARGGAVIGNAFKTIFTRIQRTDVLQKLRNIGVAVTDMNGEMLSGMQVLQNLANNFDTLSKSQRASVSESVAGVFQVNILKAAMTDLSSATSHYKGALHAANTATDEAYKRNEELNKSLDALANRTLANLTQVGASLGGGTLEPAIKRVLNIVNSSIESFGKGGLMEGFGKTWGKGIMKGLGDFIAGPGLVLVVATIGKLFYNLTKFTGKAFADIMGINKAAQQRVTIEGAIVDTLSKEPALLSSILSGDTKILTIEQQILATIRKQNLERQAMQIVAGPMATSMMGRGVHVGRSGGMSFKGGGRAGGFVPNFANAGSERAAAAAGGYQAGSIRTMNQPGAGTMMYNSAETVKRFPGMSQSAIMPPQGSPAGAGYKSAFGAAHGFDPYAGSGFIPNFFNTYSKFGKGVTAEGVKRQMPTTKGHLQTIGKSKAGKGDERQLWNDFVGAGGHLTVKKNALAMLLPKLGYQNLKHTGKGTGNIRKWTATFPSLGYSDEWVTKNKKKPPEDIVDQMVKAAARVSANVSRRLEPPGTDWDGPTFEKAIRGTLKTGHAGHGIKGAMGSITGAAGSAFETGVLAAMQLSASDPENKSAMAPGGLGFKPADWDVYNPNTAVKSLFGGGAVDWKKGDLKITDKETPVDSMINKLLNDLLYGGERQAQLTYKSNLEKKTGRKVILTPKGELAYERPSTESAAAYARKQAKKGSPEALEARRVYEQDVRDNRGGGGGARGYVPNFASALSNAIGREMQAGIPASAIRVGSSPTLRSAGNPGGVGVFNTKHEPGGLQQGISRSRAGGINPKTHGVPNFNLDIVDEFGVSPYDPIRSGKAGRAKGGVSASLRRNLVNGLNDLTKASSKAAAATASTVKPMGMFKKATEKLKGIGGARGIGIGMAAPMIVGALQEGTNWGKEGGVAGGLMGMASQGAQWGGTGMMIHPYAGAAGAILGGLYGAITGFADTTKSVAETVKELTAEMDKLGKRESRTAETFSRIAEEMDKINKAGGGKRFSKIEEQRNELTSFVKEEYGDEKLYSGVFKGIRQAKTGEQIRDLKIKAGNIYQSDLASREMQAGAVGTEVEVLSGIKSGAALSLAGQKKYDRTLTDIDTLKNKGLITYRSNAGSKVMRRPASDSGLEEFWALKRYQDDLAELEKNRKRGSITGLAGLITGGEFRKSGTSVANELADLSMTKEGDTYKGRTFNRTLFGEQRDARTALLAKRARLEGSISRSTGMKDIKGMESPMQYLAGEIAAQSGLDQAGRDKLETTLMTKAQEAAKMDGPGGFSALDAMQELGREMLNGELSLKKLNEVLKERADEETRRVAQLKDAIDKQDTRTKAFQTEIGLLDELAKATIEASAGLKHVAAMSKLQTAFNNKMVGLSGRGVVSRMGARGDAYDVAQARRNASQATESVRYTGAKTDAEAAFTKAKGELQLKGISGTVKDIFKDALGGTTGLSKDVIAARRKDVESIKMGLKGNLGRLSPDDILKLEQTLKNFGGLAAGEGGENSLKLDKTQRDRLKSARETLASFRKLNADYKNQQVQLEQQNENNKKYIEETLKLNNEEIDLKFEFNKKARDLVDKMSASQARQQAAEAKDRMRSGKITGGEGVGLYKNELERRRTAEGLGPMGMEQKASFRQGFKGGMTYSPRDYLDELEDGSRQVATTMKTSFADAFKSIASGASSAQEAMAQFAGNILNTISDMSAQMATNMMFAKMGFAKGGEVPRYGGGGVVTGGSGTKDDVLSMMNAGEYVIKKSSAKKIGYDTLNAINSGGVGGFAEGGAQKGGNMGKMFAVSAAASAASGLVSGQWGKSKKKPWRGQDYGHGRGEYGYFGGPDSDARGADSIAGGGRGAQVSLNKAYVYYRRDPETGKLVSERVRPTEGKYEVSGALSLLGRLNEDDRQTGRMFGKEQKMGAYSDYLFGETERRKEVMKAHKKQKKGRLISAYMNAAMLIGGSYMMGKTGPAGQAAAKGAGDGFKSTFTDSVVARQGGTDISGSVPSSWWGNDVTSTNQMNLLDSFHGNPSIRNNMPQGGASGSFGATPDGRYPYGFIPDFKTPSFPKGVTGGSMGRGSGSPALLTGGEYVMGADTVRQYGLDFMGELNRGGVPGMAAGGPVSRGNQGAIAGMVAGGETNNNVNISINVDKRGNVEAQATQGPDTEDNANKENTVKDAENNKDLGKALQTVVLQELIRQQRPGGLLQKGPNTP